MASAPKWPGSPWSFGFQPHDYVPHHHSVSPWGGVRSYGMTPLGPTRSYNGLPYSGGYYGGGYPPYAGGAYGGSYGGGYVPYGGGW